MRRADCADRRGALALKYDAVKNGCTRDQEMVVVPTTRVSQGTWGSSDGVPGFDNAN